jgi:WD40 repeat protein
VALHVFEHSHLRASHRDAHAPHTPGLLRCQPCPWPRPLSAPHSYIYDWPSLALLATLPSGTERAYSAAAFDAEGELLASVGSAPDYSLTLWTWRSGQATLQARAFSQEVYHVAFSPFAAGRLVTSGTGHIRFWRMASTFTGLKLQVTSLLR